MSNQIGLKKVLFAAVAAMCGAFGAFGADTWAAVDGSPDASGTENEPMDLYTAITSQAKDGMTGSVYIKPGHYKLEDILPDGVDAIVFDKFDASASQPRRATLLIAGSTGNPLDVIIDGCGKHRFLDSRDASIPINMKTLTVAGLTVSNCQTTATSKSAISLAKGGSGDARIDPVGIVTNCVFVDCHSTAAQSGGAIYGNRVQALDCAFDSCTVSNTATATPMAGRLPYCGTAPISHAARSRTVTFIQRQVRHSAVALTFRRQIFHTLRTPGSRIAAAGLMRRRRTRVARLAARQSGSATRCSRIALRITRMRRLSAPRRRA